MRHLITVALLTSLFLSCKKDEDRSVEYVVSCSSCDLTYSNSSEDTEQNSMSGSWNYRFTAVKDQFLYISAQNNNSSGNVDVKILVGSNTFKHASSSGAYVIATASGSMP